MITKKASFNLEGHHIEFALVFNPLKLMNHEELSIDNNVVAKSECSWTRRQSVLTVDYPINGVTRKITAISAPMASGLKQGIQICIDNEFVSGDRDLDFTKVENDSETTNEVTQNNSAKKPLIFKIITTYIIVLALFAVSMIKSYGFSALIQDISIDALLFMLIFATIPTGLALFGMKIVRKTLK